MSLSVNGRIKKKLEIESGVSKAGKDWKKQSFILDTKKDFNPEICFQMFGEEKIKMLESYKEGDEVEVSFNLSSREYNGKYYHNVDAWRITKMTIDTESENLSDNLPVFDEDVSEEDDLPF